jgi:hypothetical protein
MLPLCALVAGLAQATPLAAQRIIIQGRGDLVTDTILQRVTRAGSYRLITADTVYPPADTMRGLIVIAGTTVKLENRIEGDLLIIDANVFLRPNARITGTVINIAGGLFPAPTAHIDGEVREYKSAPYAAERSGSNVRVVGTQVASLLDLDGLGGLREPAYDRVSGLSLTLGARYLLPRLGTTEPELRGSIGYQTARQTFHGSVEAAIRNGNFRLRAGATRAVLTNDTWARGFTNNISYLTRGHDYRDYYDADRFYFGPLVTWSDLRTTVAVRLDAQIENARSLVSRDPWHASGDPARPNPAIDEGRITSLVLAANSELERRRFVGRTDAAIEFAADVLGGEHEFARFDIGGRWAVEALTGQTFQVRWRLRGPLGSDSLPRQRWSMLGGRATLFTLDEGELRGDRLAYVQSEYIMPLPPAFRLPVLGRANLDAVHRVGWAWTNGNATDFVQNLAGGLRFRFLYIFAGVDPAKTSDVLFLFGVSVERRFPWSID